MEFEDGPPGCMGAIFHLFHFPQRFSMNKALPYKKRGTGKQAQGFKIAGTSIEEFIANKDVKDLPLIKNENKKTTRTRNKGKTSIKSPVGEETSKELQKGQQIQALSARLMRTNSIHHLECTVYERSEKLVVNDYPAELLSHDESNSFCGTQIPFLPEYMDEQIIYNQCLENLGNLYRSTENSNTDITINVENRSDEKQFNVREKVDGAAEAFLGAKLMDCKKLGRDVLLQPTKEFLDAIDVFNENRELFLDILNCPTSILAKQSRNDFKTRAELNKCGSFPAPEFSFRRAGSLVKINKKQQEIPIHAKHERKSRVTTVNATLGGGNYSESLPIKATDNDRVESNLKYSPDPPHELTKHKEGGKFMNRFKDIRHRIKHAFKENKKERFRVSMDRIFHVIPYGRKDSDDAFKHDADTPRNSFNSPNAASAYYKGSPLHIVRTPSLTESLEKYAQLLESISRKESTSHLPQQRKFTNEDGSEQSRRLRKSFQRVLSMPENGSLFLGRYIDSDMPLHKIHKRTPSMIIEDGIADVESYSLNSQKPVNTLNNTEKCSQLCTSEQTKLQENCLESINGSLDGDLERLETSSDGYACADDTGSGDGDILLQEQGTRPINNVSNNTIEASPLSVLNSFVRDDILSPNEVPISEGPEAKAGRLVLDELDNDPIRPQDQRSMDGPFSLEIKVNSEEAESPGPDSDFSAVHAIANSNENADYNYVRDVLELSGFTGNESLGAWHSPQKPVGHSLFEAEHAPSKPDDPGDEAGDSYHQLLFDLINEVLLEIYERSFPHCPWRLCSSSNIRPVPIGVHVLDEVWNSISWRLNSRQNLSLECIVAQDLAKYDGWMNPQEEAECLGSEFEEWILDDLLDEVTYELTGRLL